MLFLGPLGGIPVKINVRHHLWLALSYLFEATKWSTVCGCLCWVWVPSGRAKLHAKVGFYQHQTHGQESKGQRNNIEKQQRNWDLPLPASCLLGSITGIASNVRKLLVVCSRFSVSHHVGVHGVHHADTDSNSVPGLVWGSAKVSGYTKASHITTNFNYFHHCEKKPLPILCHSLVPPVAPNKHIHFLSLYICLSEHFL